MEKFEIGIIRKITIGPNPKDALAVVVGGSNHIDGYWITVDSIIRDETNFYFFGNIRYLVMAFRKEDKEKRLFVWKVIENVPVLIECDVNLK